mgnify:CR=1 FL=1
MYKILTFMLFTCITFSLSAENHIIKAKGMKWKPEVLKINVGDSVKFANMIGHDTETISALIPADQEGWKSSLGDEGFSVKLEKQGVYIYKCNPHVIGGMFGAIIVGSESENSLAAHELNIKQVGPGRAYVRKLLKKVRKTISSSS